LKPGLIASLLLVLLVFGTFAPTLANAWIWDDDSYVTNNPTLTSEHGLHDIWTDRSATPQYYPVVHTSFWIERRLWGDDSKGGPNPFGYHFDNLLIQAGCALLLWRFFLRLGLPGAWFLAALCALHPVNVESVAWVTERKNLLSMLFALGSATCFWDWAERRRSLVALFASVSFFLLALFSKSVVASLPAVLLLLLWWKHRPIRARVLVPLVVMLLFGAVMGWMTAMDEVQHVGAVGANWDYGFGERVVIAGHILWFYLAKLVWPHPLIFIYRRWATDGVQLWQWLYPLSFLALLLGLFLSRRRLGRGPLVAFLIFAGVLFPALGFLNVYPHKYSFVADHFQHHAMPAILVLIGVGLWRLLPALGPDRRPRAAGFTLWSLLLLLLAGLSFEQCFIYKDEETLWQNVVQRNPKASIGFNNLGRIAYQRNDFVSAGEYFRRAVAVRPDNAEAQNNLGQNLMQHEGNFVEAEKHLLAAIESAPKFVLPNVQMGDLCRLTNRPQEAIRYYIKANELNVAVGGGKIPQVCYQLAGLLLREGKTQAAIDNYLYALKSGRTSVLAGTALIWIFCTHEDPAFRDHDRAAQLVRQIQPLPAANRWQVLDAFAAFAADAGNWDQAIRQAERALRIATKRGKEEALAGIEKRLDLYRQHRPYRSPGGYPE